MLNNDVISRLLHLNPIVIYGEQGSGRTIFMFQTCRSLLVKGYIGYFLTSKRSYNTISKYLKLRSRDSLNLRIYIYDDFSLKKRLKHFLDVLKDAENILNKELKISLFLDDFVPIQLQLARSINVDAAKFLSKLLFWTKFLSNLNQHFFIMISTLENVRRSLPFKARFYISYGFNLLHICRVSRIRKFYLPKIDPTKIAIVKLEELWKGLVSPQGFIMEKAEQEEEQ